MEMSKLKKKLLEKEKVSYAMDPIELLNVIKGINNVVIRENFSQK